MPLGVEVGLGPCDFVFDGDPAPPEKGTTPTQYLAHVYCGTAGWIKMPLGTEVNLSPGDVVLYGVAAPPTLKWHSPPVFGSCLLWPNGWMDTDATWYGSRPRPRPRCVIRDPASPRTGHSSPPLFDACLLWPRSPISATAEANWSLVTFYSTLSIPQCYNLHLHVFDTHPLNLKPATCGQLKGRGWDPPTMKMCFRPELMAARPEADDAWRCLSAPYSESDTQTHVLGRRGGSWGTNGSFFTTYT